MNDDYISRSAGIIALAHRKCGNDEYDIAVQDCIETLKHIPAADLKRLVREAIEKAGGAIVLELKDGGVVRRVRINPDGSIERLWKEEQD